MEMSAKLLPIGFSSPAILLCFILAFKADVTYRSFITSSGICWKDWFQKSLSEYVTVSIAVSLFDEFYAAERCLVYRVRRDVCMAQERDCTSVKDAELQRMLFKNIRSGAWNVIYIVRRQFSMIRHSTPAHENRNSVYFNGEVVNFPLKLSSKAYWH